MSGNLMRENREAPLVSGSINRTTSTADFASLNLGRALRPLTRGRSQPYGPKCALRDFARGASGNGCSYRDFTRIKSTAGLVSLGLTERVGICFPPDMQMNTKPLASEGGKLSG